MRIIVSDGSCLIDLRTAALLGVFLSLPYEILIPNTLLAANTGNKESGQLPSMLGVVNLGLTHPSASSSDNSRPRAISQHRPHINRKVLLVARGANVGTFPVL